MIDVEDDVLTVLPDHFHRRAVVTAYALKVTHVLAPRQLRHGAAPARDSEQPSASAARPVNVKVAVMTAGIGLNRTCARQPRHNRDKSDISISGDPLSY